MRSFVVTLDGRVLEAGAPLVRADDPLFSRGDGVFETLLVRDGRPALLEAHLTRLSGSAGLAALPAPDVDRLRAAASIAAGRCTAAEAVLRLVHGRGRGEEAVAFVAVSPVPDRVAAARRDGVAAMTLDRGPYAEVAPWSLAAAKSASYAHNTAALRYAERRGFGDVVFVDGRGTVLEGPRSTVVVGTEAGLVTPPSSLPILPGTTARALFAAARERGVPCREDVLTVPDLHAAQGVWLLSAVTLAARVHSLDGVALRPVPDAGDMAALVDFAIRTDLPS